MRTAALGAMAAGGAAAANEKTAEGLKVAVIGHTGRGGYGHGLDTMWMGVPGVKIAGVADADDGGLKSAIDRLGGVAGFGDYREMLRTVKPEIVSVAPRHIDQHRDMCLAAIAAGAKGIYVEKPFCRTPAEADEIVVAAGRAGTKIALAHRNRYHPALPVVRKLVEEGKIGRLLEIRTRGKEDGRGGMLDLWVLGSHVLNLAAYFTGDPLACCATVLKKGRPVTKNDVTEGQEGTGPSAGDEVHARYETRSGVPIFFDSIVHAGTKEANFGLQLVGTEGLVDLRVDTEPLAHLMEGNPFLPKGAREWISISSAGAGIPESARDLGKSIASHRTAALDLLDAMRENREPLCGMQEGKQTVEMIGAVMESHVSGGGRIEMPSAIRGNAFAGDW